MVEIDPSIEKRIEARGGPLESEAIRSVASYETEECVVFYDSKNPRAWIESDDTIDLDTAA